MGTINTGLRGALIGAALAILCTPAAVHAQQKGFPERPLTMAVPVVAGGLGDIFARLVATGLVERMGQPVVVQNRPPTLGMELMQRAAPDGYTFSYVSNSNVTHHLTSKVVQYNVMQEFQPITIGAEGTLGLVANPDKIKATTVQELVAFARANPGKLNYASTGVGSTAHTNAEWFQQITGIKLVHVPYKAGVQAMMAIVSGEVDVGFMSIGTFLPHTKAGKARLLAITTAKRSEIVPSASTIREGGFDLVNSIWIGFVTSMAAPKTIATRLATEISTLVHTPNVKEKFLAIGLEPVGGTPEEFVVAARREIETIDRLRKSLGLQPE